MSTTRHAPGCGQPCIPPQLHEVREAIVDGTRVCAHAASAEAWKAEIVVGVALHDQADLLPACLGSILTQRCDRRVGILIVDDASTDGWMANAAPYLAYPGMVVVNAACGTAGRTRNRILAIADEFFPCGHWVARLDADDRFTDPCSLAAACALGERRHANWILGGNRLRQDGIVLEKTNPATERLLEQGYVLDLLRQMAAGTARSELCSCNLVLARRSGFRYPDVASAEDHWLVADLLINHPHRGAILQAPFYCDYTLEGRATLASRRGGMYLRSRQALYRTARQWIENRANRERACC